MSEPDDGVYTAPALPPERTDLDTSLRGDDPGHWGHSMANMAELILPILEAAEVTTLAEVGAYAGDFTEVLVDWAAGADARVVAIDPLPQPTLIELSERRPELELIAETSAVALRDMEMPDAVIIDGDHNYHTVSEELRWIGERSAGADTPLLLFHDVVWPHGRRDAYYAPDRVPPEYQDSIVEGVGVFPGEPGVTSGGLPYKWAAKREGGPRNGVLTAIEDFLDGRDRMHLAIVPMFFGLGVAWHRDAPWADAVAALVAPWDRNPILARLEGNRTLQLTSNHRSRTEMNVMEGQLRGWIAHQDKLLRAVLESEGYALADRLTSLRHRGKPSLRDAVREVVDESPPSAPWLKD